MTRRPSIPFTHGVHEDVCAVVGERAALIFNRIAYYVEYNALSGEHLHDGQHFARVTVPDLLTVFHWLNKDKISYAIKALIDADLLCVPIDDLGEEVNLSKLGWKRGRWFSHGTKSPINPKVEKSTLHGVESSPSKVEKSAFEGGKSSPAIGNTSSYTSSYANTQTRASADVGAGLNKAVLDQIHERWNAMAGEHSFPLVQRMTQDRIRLIKTRLAESGGALAPILTVIERVPLMCGWQGGGKRGHITFDWILGPPRDGRPDRFLEALEFNPQTPKAENVQLNPNSYDAKQAVLVDDRRASLARAVARRQSDNSGPSATLSRLAP